MYDPSLKYCPQCKDEYLDHVERCAACNLPLESGAVLLERQRSKQSRLAGRTGELSDSDELVTIHGGPLTDLKHLQDLFAGERIAARIIGDDSSCGKGCCPSVFYLQVRAEDVEDALVIIKQEYLRLTGSSEQELNPNGSVFDQQADEVICPACGHNFSPTITTCPDCGLCFG